jgi:acetyltransferase
MNRRARPGRAVRPPAPRRDPHDKTGLPGLDPLFRPRAVAVVGASRNPASIGRMILVNLIDYGFQGPVYPVNPKAPVVHSMRSYRRVSEIPGPVDLAILAIPADRVPAAVDDCGRKGVKGLVVITAGFKEIGGEGAEREERLLMQVRRYGMRMVGPNCMGLVNTAPGVRLNASFAQATPEPGIAGFITQSGALGEVILANAREINLGIARFVSIGNKPDVSGNDLLLHWEDDPDVRLILMYLESFGDPQRFTEIARRVSRKKPILAVKAGRTAAGARAAFSHTGALAGLDVAVDTLFEQCGVIRARSMEELFTLAPAFATQPIPKGNRVAVLSNAGGPAILATDALVAAGLELADLSPATRSRLRRAVPPECSVANPVDLIASADEHRYEAALGALARDPGLDALLVIFVSPVMINSLEVARRIVAAARRTRRPLLTCFMGKRAAREAVDLLRRAGVPVYPFPELAAEALAAMVHYRRLLDRPERTEERLRVDRAGAERVLRRAAGGGRRQLAPEEAEALLSAYGVPFARSIFAESRAQAIDAGHTLGYPVVLKAAAPGLVHKSDVGGVRADLRNADEVAEAYDAIVSSLGRVAGLRVQVQPMVQGGREVILGMFHDPQFGPLLMFGLGGVFVEYLRDVTFGLHPIGRHDAEAMIAALRGRQLLEGARGGAPVDKEALVDALLRLSRLVGDFPQLEQVEVNPFLACPRGRPSLAVDARVRLRGPAASGR